MMNSGIFYILNHLDVKGDLPLQIIPDHTFREAHKKEIEEINRVLLRSKPPASGIFWAYFESVIRSEKNAGRTASHKFEESTESEWKYWVIAFEGWNEKLLEIEKCALLLEPDLDFGFQILYEYEHQAGKVAAHTFMPIHLVEKYTSQKSMPKTIEISTDELKKISKFYELMSCL